ncbi:MAG: hypothetical protein IKS41_00980 [Alphaproteobacteria bacterium]|nr:hypothetical protein [Alphaproteobacteria bacterium]
MAMSRFICIISCLFLFGCVQQPKYYSSVQDIDLVKKYGITDAKVIYEGKEFESADIIPIERSYSDKELIIRKKGYQDYHLKLISDWTDEKWATENDVMINNYDVDVSAAYLFIPMGTITSIVTVIGIIYLPWGIANDVYNIVIGAPSTLIVNPWRKFYMEEKILLVPSEELKKTCSKKGYFISNAGCIKCETAGRFVAEEKERDRCPNRFNDSVYSYSCNYGGMVYTSAEECNKCPSRKYYFSTSGDGMCVSSPLSK